MALGTPVAAAAAYSGTGGGAGTVSPAYPSGILATDAVLLFIGQKPATANGGGIGTLSGWTLRESLTGAGGYGTTLGADTGNTNLYCYSWDAPVAGQTGNLSVSLTNNNVAWAFMVRIPGGGSYSYGSADGSRTTAPTSGTAYTVTLTNGTTAPNLQSGDLAIWAMCTPTDVLAGAGFSAHTISSSGTTFGTVSEFNEPSSGTANDIGGYSAWASATSGSSTAAPTVGATATGTVTNVRGPILLVRVRDTSQELTPSKYDNSQTFYSPTVAAGTVTLTPGLYSNEQTFFSPEITQSGGVQTLTPALYTNDQSFFAPTVAATYALTPDLYTNTQTFYAATVTTSYTLTPALYTNDQTFFSPDVTQTGGAQDLKPSLYTNDQTFYQPTVTAGAVDLASSLYTNGQTFYQPTITTGFTLAPDLYTNTQDFFQPSVTVGAVDLAPTLYTNTSTFFSPVVAVGGSVIAPDLYTNEQTFYSPTVAAGAITLAPELFTNDQTFYAPTVAVAAVNLTPSLFTNDQVFYSPTVAAGAASLTPSLYTNTQTFYNPSVTAGAANLDTALFTNGQTFFDPAVTTSNTLATALYTNTSTFFEPTVALASQVVEPPLVTNTSEFFTVTVAGGALNLAPPLIANTSQFFEAAVATSNTISFDEYVAPGYSTPGYVSPITFNNQQFFPPTVTPGAITLAPALFTNVSTVYPVRRVSTRITDIYRLLANRQELDPVAGKFRVYEDDGVTVFMEADAWENATGTIRYRGKGLARIDRLN